MRLIAFLMLAGLITLLSCDKNLEGKEYHFPSIELNHCSDTSINGYTVQICFDSVYDSRCPLNMECVWQGEAVVKLTMNTGAQHQSFKLSTMHHPPAFPNDTIISGYKIKLISVAPYPGHNSNQPYRVELSVSR